MRFVGQNLLLPVRFLRYAVSPLLSLFLFLSLSLSSFSGAIVCQEELSAGRALRELFLASISADG